jgi:phenylpropionate dioxygenase-like ring-hydroxylating dioxygenase large terminal subunit
MRLAYGRQTPPPDYELTCVEPGSRMGELLRRYWQPVCTSDELQDLPRKVKLLCEELVVFRDKKGRVGALEPHCSHRGTSLEWGRVEEEGLRCCYHGWLYDTQGQCIDMPCETEEFRERMDVWHPAYPTTEYGGLVFVYMGPPGTEPLLPMYDIIDTRYRNDVVLRGMRLWGEYSVGFVKDCNWLQHYEKIVDPWHLLMLHQMISGDQFEGALMQGAPQIGFENTSLGVRYRVVKDLPIPTSRVRKKLPPKSPEKPTLTKAVTSLVEVPAIRRSQPRARASPAPAAGPLTIAIDFRDRPPPVAAGRGR